MSRPTTSTINYLWLKTPEKQKLQDQTALQANSTKHLELTPILLKLLQKLQRKNTSELIPWRHHRLDNQNQRYHKKTQNNRLVSLMTTYATILNKILVTWLKQYIKRLIHHDQVEFIPGMQGTFNLHKTIGVIQHISKLKN